MGVLPHIQEPRILSITSRWLVLDKPPGWISIPGTPGSASDAPVVLDWARSHPENREQGLWVVHRIDRETSGVLLMARTPDAHREASLWFQNRKVKKTYDCLATGEPKAPTFRIDVPVGGARSLSLVDVRERRREGFLARVTPLTGRRHQIRIHLASTGNPLFGDTTYGGPRSVAFSSGSMEIGRVCLHASRLELPTGESFESPWPADFQGWLDRLLEEGSRADR